MLDLSISLVYNTFHHNIMILGSNYIFLHTCTGAGNIENYQHETNFTCTTLDLGSMDHTKIVQEL